MEIISLILSFIRGCFSVLKESREKAKASRDRLASAFDSASKQLSLCLSKGSESLKMILETLDSNDGQFESGYHLSKDCLELVTEFNKAQVELLKVLDSNALREQNSKEYAFCKDSLIRILEEYGQDLQDITLVVKLSRGILVEPGAQNSFLLNNIFQLFQDPVRSINDIISLRFGSNFPKDYYDEVTNLCNRIATVVSLPENNKYHLVSTPFRALIGVPEQQYQLGLLFLKQGREEDAVRWLIKAVERGYYEANYILGKLKLSQGDKEAGLMLLKEAANKKHENSIIELGNQYYEDGRFEDAIECYSQIKDERRDIKFYLAKAYYEIERTAQSIKLFSELVGLQGDALDIYSAAGMYHIVEAHFAQRIPMPNFDAILEFYTRVKDSVVCDDISLKDYLQTKIPIQIARIFKAQNKIGQAFTIFNDCLKKDSPVAECQMGWLLYSQSANYEDPDPILCRAEDFFSLSAKHNYYEAYVGLGMCQMAGSHEDYYFAKTPFEYFKLAANHNELLAYKALTMMYKNKYSEIVGEGCIEDGRIYEEKGHIGLFQYYYYSILDNNLYESKLTDACPISLNDANSPSWWMTSEEFHDYDLLTRKANESQPLPGYYQQDALIALEPSFGPVQEDRKWPIIVTVLRGRIRVSLSHLNVDFAERHPVVALEEAVLDNQGNLFAQKDLASTDEIHALYIDCLFQSASILSLEPGTVYRVDYYDNYLLLFRKDIV